MISETYFSHREKLHTLIHPVEFLLCGTPFGVFHRADFFHAKKKGWFSLFDEKGRH